MEFLLRISAPLNPANLTVEINSEDTEIDVTFRRVMAFTIDSGVSSRPH